MKLYVSPINVLALAKVFLGLVQLSVWNVKLLHSVRLKVSIVASAGMSLI